MEQAKKTSILQRAKAAIACSLSTGADFLVLAALVRVANVPAFGAAVVSAGVGAGLNFTLQRHLVFEATAQGKRRQLPRYLAVALTTILLSKTLIREIEGGAGAAIGSRYAEPEVTERRQPWFRVAWSRLTNFVVQRVLLRGIRDTQCGFKAFRAGPAKRVFEQVPIPGWGFDLEVLTLFDRMGYRIKEVPVPFKDDRRTKINPIKDAVGVVKDFLRVYRNLLRGRYELDRATSDSLR